jgi:hypothetical protein
MHIIVFYYEFFINFFVVKVELPMLSPAEESLAADKPDPQPCFKSI